MREYKAVYKCRLCGEEDYSIVTVSKKHVLLSVLRISKDEEYLGGGIPLSLRHIHNCKDGSLGLSDFQGWRKNDEGMG